MKNKISLTVAIFAVSLLIVPHITFASWWNPFTWKSIKKSEVKTEQVIIATSTPDNRTVRMEKATTTVTGVVKIIQSKEIKSKDNKDSTVSLPKTDKVKVKESLIITDRKSTKTADKLKQKAETLSIQAEKKQEATEKQKSIELPQQPRLIFFQDNLGNIYTEEKDFVGKASEPFNNGFGSSYVPLCMRIPTTADCQPEIVRWVNNRSIETGKTLNVALDSFDANGDDIFYYITYGSREDWGYGNMRVLQSWGANNTFDIPITEQLYKETLFENLAWSSTFFEAETRKYYNKNVKLNNAGELNIQLCFNDKPEQMERGEQFPYGCMLFTYFILKPGYSNLTTSTQPQ